ncbi:MAG: EAL domain-containing protein [Demequinaceae bacterium]|nr:EAL domain-containing protein [Demequinaceae bacterium]
MTFVLLAVSVFAVWSSQATANAAGRAAEASAVSNDFARAALAVATAESLEREFRLEPGLGTREDFEAASDELVAALGQAREHGNRDQRFVVAHVLASHRLYLNSVNDMFAAVNRGDDEEAQRIDSSEVEPSYGVISRVVRAQAEEGNARAVAEIASLQRVEALTRALTPAVFVLGLLLVAWFASIIRDSRRLVDVERARAVHDSLHDALTGLPNRTLLAQRCDLALEVGASAGSTTGMLLIDLDRFKDINDTFGHHYGDGLLAQIGPRLQGCLREGDTIARLGGDEFAVLLPDIGDLQAATAIAESLRRALESPFAVEGVVLDIEASVGIVLSGEHGRNSTALLQHVDIAMYLAKSRNLGVFVYDPELDKHSPRKLALLGDLRRAIDGGELFLHFQPKISIGTGEVIGAEALVRWNHPTRGVLFPDTFVPIAEHSGLIGPMTRVILAEALAQARRWCDEGRPLPIAVNLSARNLLDDDLPQQVATLLDSYKVPASLLKLEVTESAIMSDPMGAARRLRVMADLGVRISIDDFGAGYTSLGHLKSLPITELKIDKSFVLAMGDDASDALIVHSVVDLGHNLGLTIVAEGVENAAALEQLATYGCDAAQGYFICRPIPADAFDEWFIEYRAVRVGGDALS